MESRAERIPPSCGSSLQTSGTRKLCRWCLNSASLLMWKGSPPAPPCSISPSPSQTLPATADLVSAACGRVPRAVSASSATCLGSRCFTSY
ncbi:DENND1C isoform 12 [Pan troglodytes]|uniref:DENN domain containing 1C n=2 Tax=Homininae TaxID=207598 RepID=K7EM30_HUMAN|nr:DENN domain containing 1C [Homo sapiens]KAI4039911.1 DENN domain containing 1C [Homo sapiens]PNI25467.1 DENND1C isoform 12 [Pan troglodytes]